MKSWLAIIVGSCLAIAFMWGTSFPLGIPDEWTWERATVEPDWIWNLGGGSIAASLLVAFIWQGYVRLAGEIPRRWRQMETTAWLTGLVAISFVWLWIVQEVSPVRNRLGKSAFVLFYPGSSGYFKRARYEQPKASQLLSGYEALMREGDVLHTGTHPPGLFLIFHGLIALCGDVPELNEMLDVTQSGSFREACDVIAANNLRLPRPQSFLPHDRRVLWLATLLVSVSASLTVVPLYALIRRTASPSIAWVCSAIWPAIPAVAVFIPKSDTVFPLVAVTFLWLWLTAWDRRSIVLATVAGFVAWCGLLCSLVFLPVFLLAGIATLFLITQSGANARLPISEGAAIDRDNTGARRWLCLICACAGFASPTLMFWRYAHVNLLYVWWMNYRNHAGFYQAYSRTYWKWLLVNPIELAFAAGWPVAFLALLGACRAVTRRRIPVDSGEQSTASLTIPILLVWGLLWLTGKNSGEVARLWIMFLPWLILVASEQVKLLIERGPNYLSRERSVVALLAFQFLNCLFTVARVSGFNLDIK